MTKSTLTFEAISYSVKNKINKLLYCALNHTNLKYFTF